MVDGESGIMAVCPRDERPKHNASKRRLEWPNGAISLLFSAEEPDRLRGKQHSKLACDELAAWRYEDAWVQAKLGLRLGSRPQIVVSTTPRPTKLIREIVADPRTHITRGKTRDNFANLADVFIVLAVIGWGLMSYPQGFLLTRNVANSRGSLCQCMTSVTTVSR